LVPVQQYTTDASIVWQKCWINKDDIKDYKVIWKDNSDVVSFRDCFRYLRQFDLDFGGMLERLIPPEEIRHLGYLIANIENDIDLTGERAIPVFVCKTPIDDVRTGPGEPSGKIHLAELSDRSIRKIAPIEFEALDKSLYVDIETVIRELPDKSMDSDKQYSHR
jgi:hypothetical protein